jgi:hypothetical protein
MDAVALILERGVVELVDVVHGEAPVVVDPGVDARVDEVAVLEEGVVGEQLFPDRPGEALGGHPGEVGVDLGEVEVAVADGELAVDAE